MAEEQTSRILNKEIFVLVALAFATFLVFAFTKSMATREQQMETRIAVFGTDKARNTPALGRLRKQFSTFAMQPQTPATTGNMLLHWPMPWQPVITMQKRSNCYYGYASQTPKMRRSISIWPV